ncbi:MAG: hypothetical protein AAGH81_08770 [Bacteroidota bacterium]
MKFLLKFELSLLFILTLQNPLTAQQDVTEKKDNIRIAHKTSFHSNILKERREFYVSLPSNYDKSVHDCPVIYVMDAEYLFDITQAIAKIRASRNYMPQSIVIGIVNNTGKRNDMPYFKR